MVEPAYITWALVQAIYSNTANVTAVNLDDFQIKLFDIYLTFAYNINYGYTVVLKYTHNLCFEQIKMFTPSNASFTV